MTLDEIAAYLAPPGIALLWSAAVFLAGTFLGSRLNRDWDKTKEFNAAAMPIKAQLMIQLNDIRFGQRTPELSEMHILSQMMSPRVREQFYEAMKAYQDARQQHIIQDIRYGTGSYARTDHIAKALRHLISFLDRKG